MSKLSRSIVYLAASVYTLCFVSINRVRAQSNSVLPTDVVPLAGPQERGFMSDRAQITLLNRLPSRFYLNASCENSFRLETNPFQFPPRSSIIRQATGGQPFAMLDLLQQQQLGTQLSEVNASQQIFRTLPNLTGGWTLTSKTRVYGNYFALHDCAMQNTVLNSVVQSVGMGIQQDIPLTSTINLQADFQGRELFQSKQVPVFDYLPSLTLSYAPSSRTVAFLSTVLQLRGRQPFTGATREIDPFYTFGVVRRAGRWTLSAYATFVQNFRQPFGSASLIPVNNYTWVLDFEAARPLTKRLPSLQAFVRAEPVFNFHSKATPGFSGNDFRLFYGLRMSLGKPSLLPINQLVRQQLKEVSKAKRMQRNQGSQQTPSSHPQPNQSNGQSVSPPNQTNTGAQSNQTTVQQGAKSNQANQSPAPQPSQTNGHSNLPASQKDE
ncbi:MAG: hypothetical protein C5B53_12695 [Candidatus Melainabacteria bacterium]|nr:MAG: hypothetical protein C5B53_12695 [Candidatus Melainabacteria bacterium]